MRLYSSPKSFFSTWKRTTHFEQNTQFNKEIQSEFNALLNFYQSALSFGINSKRFAKKKKNPKQNKTKCVDLILNITHFDFSFIVTVTVWRHQLSGYSVNSMGFTDRLILAVKILL